MDTGLAAADDLVDAVVELVARYVPEAPALRRTMITARQSITTRPESTVRYAHSPGPTVVRGAHNEP